MVGCSFQGRLGNNLFQAAAAIGLSHNLNVDFILPETTYAGHRGIIPVDLSLFNYKFNRVAEVNLHENYNEEFFHYVPLPEKDNLKINGFFVSEKYFLHIKDLIIDTYFAPIESITSYLQTKYSTILNSQYEKLGICVRREDFLWLQHNHCVLGVDYYKSVLEKYFSNYIGYFFIFSDDIPWCQTVFGNNKNIIYVKESVNNQFFLMTYMDYMIIPNSTFSWWGAYLNKNIKKVVAPDPWFGPNYQHNDIKDLFPPNWIIEKHEIKLQI